MNGIHIDSRGDVAASGVEPLVLLHGWGLNLRALDPLRAALGPVPPTLAVDLPGHGRSAPESWPQFQASLLAQLPARVALLGWSLGGQLALSLARAAPDKITRLILIATTPRFEAAADWPHGLAPAIVAQFARQLDTDYRRTVSDFLDLQVRGSAHADSVLGTLRAALLEHGEASTAALAAGLDLLRATDLRAVLPDIRQPTLVIGGQYDRVTPPAAQRELARRLPGAQYVELRKAAHAPFLSHTTECAAAIRAFLTGATDT
jgi:pimeloyl-[acyl-carrier protein] methyl ester esterase